MLGLVKTYEDVVINVKEFHDNINNAEELIKKLSQFRHWYYIEELEKFAPSKFIGYQNITVEEYVVGTSTEKGYMDGRDTVPRLKKWFEVIPDEEIEVYYKKLEAFLIQCDKRPNKKFQLYYKK